MEDNTVLRKTLLGQEELKTRKGGLDKKLRTLLIFVNGKSTIADMHKTLSKMSTYDGKDFLMNSLIHLKDSGFITDASERVTQISSTYGIEKWTTDEAEAIKELLKEVAEKILDSDADKIIKKIDSAENNKESIITAVDKSEKMVRLFIDEDKAIKLAKRCHAVIAGFK